MIILIFAKVNICKIPTNPTYMPTTLGGFLLKRSTREHWGEAQEDSACVTVRKPRMHRSWSAVQ